MKVAILSSCAGYGTYTPSLLLRDELTKINIIADVFVYETFFTPKQQHQFFHYKEKFHDDFRFAKIASSVATITIGNNKNEIEDDTFTNLNKYDKIIVMYGLWLPILIEVKICCEKVLCLRMDVMDTPSWKAVADINNGFKNIWMLGKNGEKPMFRINSIINENLGDQIVLHGGGWGINNFQPVLEQLNRQWSLHVIYSDKTECSVKYNSYYIPLKWLPDLYNQTYPPLIRFSDNTSIKFDDICKKSFAIISKPGGGTCLDSMRFNVPMIYLEAMANHENENAIHMLKLGYSCSFDEWGKSHFSFDKINKMRQKIASDMQGTIAISSAIKNQEI